MVSRLTKQDLKQQSVLDLPNSNLNGKKKISPRKSAETDSFLGGRSLDHFTEMISG